MASACVLGAGVLAAAAPASAAGPDRPTTAGPVAFRHSCSAPTRAGFAQCDALIRTDVVQPRAFSLAKTSANATPAGFGPADLTGAYRIPANGGGGATIAVVESGGYPNAEADLAVYRAQYGLPACTTANGCFHKTDQTGGTDYPATDTGWAAETALDLDMVSAIAPAAHIVLVEANSATMANLGASVDTAVALGADYVSNSYGAPEYSGETSLDGYYDHPGVAVVASSGDSGYSAQYPASSPYVTAVGGTSLTRSSTSRGWTETVWSGSGSGCSAYEPKPSWQTDSGCATRTATDGGTSVAAPIIAATYAVAGTPAAGSYPASYPYGRTFAVNDVTSGSNGTCTPSYLCTAGSGYDGPSGLGTPSGTAAFTQGRVISLRSHADNDYVTAENAGASPLIANRTAIGTWEEFDLIG
jgi:subtilase family serine protease